MILTHIHTLTHHSPSYRHTSHTLTQTPVRDYMLAQFTKQPSSIMRSQSELLFTKHTLLTQFSAHLNHTLSHASLRVQIIHHIQDLQHLLKSFPAVKTTYFTIGKPRDPCAIGTAMASTRKLAFERIQEMGGVNDPRQIKARPFLLLDKEGEKLMNLWYLPHITEVSL